uniref:Cytoskeleton associated protein 2 like n=1 Tax=Labrus bergylta TaxID=56723 RepID=A0A3Q3FA86_9LABR|nr:cytoskeleton-associated protein 2-like [Labrus bergylta]
MEEGETVTIPSRKELRKQKLMEFLEAKGKLKQPNPKPYLRDVYQDKTFATQMVKEKENTAPAVKLINEHTKIQTMTVQATKRPTRRTFGVTNKVNVKGSMLTGQGNACRSSATSVPVQPRKPTQNSLLKGTYTVLSSESNTNSASHFKKKPNKEIQSSDKTSSNIARTSAKNKNSKFNSELNAALLRPVKTASVRMSLGPIVKTKTGLLPAVTQPRNSQSLRHPTASISAARTTSVANMVQSSTLSSKFIFQKKTLPNASLSNPVKERSLSTTASSSTGIKLQEQNRANSKSLFGKHCNPSGLKTKSICSNCTAGPNKPDGRVGMLKPNKLTSQPTDTSSKQKSDGERKKNEQPCKVVSRTSSGPASRCSSRPVSGDMRAVLTEVEKRSKTCAETGGKKGHSSDNAPKMQTGIKGTGPRVISQTAPQPVRTISLTGQARKSSKFPVIDIPQTERKKLTAVQEERMKKLQEWRESRGISYKRPPMPVRIQVRRTMAVPQPFWATMKEEDDAHSLISAVDRSLADCIILLGEGCPSVQVKEVLSRLPVVSHKFAKYWICQARLMEQEGNLDVLPIFEEAVRVVLEPVDELRTVVFEILKKKEETKASEEDEKEVQVSSVESSPERDNNPMMTPKPVRALICGEKGDSSVVKYKITATPGGPPSQKREPTRVNGQEVRFFTPVRRSVRIERASLHYPASLQDHDLCVASYNDLIYEEDNERSEEQKSGETSPSPMYVYRQNEALKDKVVVQLVCDEGV